MIDPDNKKKYKILILPGSFYSPSSRFRILQLIKSFKKNGLNVTIEIPILDRFGNSKYPNNIYVNLIPSRIKQIIRLINTCLIVLKAKKYDLVILHRDIVPDKKVNFFEKFLFNNKIKMILDFDDAIYLGENHEKISNIIPMMEHVVIGNKYLENYAKRYSSNTTVIPTVINIDRFFKNNQRNKLFCIGWSGSNDTLKNCLYLIKNVIIELSNNFEFIFLVISDVNPKLDWKGVNIQFEKWNEFDEVSFIHKMDIGLMPLVDNEFQKGKCGFKAISYMSTGIPALASPVGVNCEIIQNKVNGFLCNNHQDWVDNISYLIKNEPSRKKMGELARKRIKEHYSIDIAVDAWLKIIYDL